MNKETNKLIPELRFPEFQNKGEWQYLNGDKLFQSISNKNHKSDLPILAITQDQGAIPRDLINYNVVVTEKSVESYKVVEIGDFIIGLRSFQGGIEYSEYKGICSPAYIILRKINRESKDQFYKYYFKTNRYIRDLNKNLEGIRDGKMISYGQFSEILLPNPNPIEQQKIADCLSSLDELITAHTDKLETLKTYKKGLMQNLFPQEGEKVPKLRFDEFQNDGDWHETTFGNVATFINGRAYKQEELLDKGKYKVLRVGNFFTNNHWYYSDLELSEDKYCVNEDLLYAWSASFGPKIWKGDKTIYHYHIWKVVTKKGIDKNFLFKSLDYETERMKTQNANGFALLHITKGTIENWKCYFPNSEKEQKKISDVLSYLDNLIEKQSVKIEQLKLQKKGLMQGLFPKVRN